MTDAERWRTVAAWFEEAAETGDFTSDRVQFGLCSALDGVENLSSLYDTRAHKALDRVRALGVNNWPPYRTRAGARFRATIALLMAHMAEDDGGNHKADA